MRVSCVPPLPLSSKPQIGPSSKPWTASCWRAGPDDAAKLARLARSLRGRARHVLGLVFASRRSQLIELSFVHRLVHASRCAFERARFALVSLCGQRRAGGLLLSARFGWHVSLLPT